MPNFFFFKYLRHFSVIFSDWLTDINIPHIFQIFLNSPDFSWKSTKYFRKIFQISAGFLSDISLDNKSEITSQVRTYFWITIKCICTMREILFRSNSRQENQTFIPKVLACKTNKNFEKKITYNKNLHGQNMARNFQKNAVK